MTRIIGFSNDRNRSKSIENFRKKVAANVRIFGIRNKLHTTQFTLDLSTQFGHCAISCKRLQEACGVAVRLADGKQQQSINQMINKVFFLSREGRSGNDGSQS